MRKNIYIFVCLGAFLFFCSFFFMSPPLKKNTPPTQKLEVTNTNAACNVVLLESAPLESSETGIILQKIAFDYSCFQFTLPDQSTIITDPYKMVDEVTADYVLESHDHQDHVDTSLITGDYSLITQAGIYGELPLQIEGINGFHNKNKNGGYGPNVIFRITYQDLTVIHLGSQGIEPDADLYKQMGQADVLIMQTDPRYPTKLTLEESVHIVEHIQPKIIILAHGDNRAEDDLAFALHYDLAIASSDTIHLSRKRLDALEKPIILDINNWKQRSIYNPYSSFATETLVF